MFELYCCYHYCQVFLSQAQIPLEVGIGVPGCYSNCPILFQAIISLMCYGLWPSQSYSHSHGTALHLTCLPAPPSWTEIAFLFYYPSALRATLLFTSSQRFLFHGRERTENPNTLPLLSYKGGFSREFLIFHVEHPMGFMMGKTIREDRLALQ